MSGVLYRKLAKPAFFLFDPEWVHQRITAVGVFLGKYAVFQKAICWAFACKSTRLHIVRDGIQFPNPVGLAAGYDWNGDLMDILPDVGFGFQTVGTITWEQYGGNSKPRLVRLPRSQALLVNKGLQGIGAKEVIKKLEGRVFRFPIGISLATTNKAFANLEEQLQDIRNSFDAFEKSEVQHSYYELNISCPNTFGGEPFTSCLRMESLLDGLDTLNIKKPVYIKMPIDLSESQTRGLLQVASLYSWVRGVVFGNLTKDHQNPAVDSKDKIFWDSHKGNLSGKPTYERSLRWITYTKKEFGSRFTIVGTGGIFTPKDAEDKLKAGAHLVQVITGMIYQGPQLIGQINQHLATHSEWKNTLFR